MKQQNADKGLIFGIQHFSIHDGAGIRSSIFLKGCPLRCRWCHNPEGLTAAPELQYYANKCTGCGKCGHIYQNLNQPVDRLEHYADSCAYKALKLVGTYMTVEEILEEVEAERIFYEQSNGGLTISGGEPMLQMNFTYRLLEQAKARGISTAIETSGYAKQEDYQKILPFTDEFLWDYKETDNRKHQDFTGVGNEVIINNLQYIYNRGAKIILRCPIIPGLNDTDEHFEGIARLSRELVHLQGVELMPYHQMGVAKGERLGDKQTVFRVPTEAEKKDWKQKIVQMGGRLF